MSVTTFAFVLIGLLLNAACAAFDSSLVRKANAITAPARPNTRVAVCALVAAVRAMKAPCKASVATPTIIILLKTIEMLSSRPRRLEATLPNMPSPLRTPPSMPSRDLTASRITPSFASFPFAAESFSPKPLTLPVTLSHPAASACLICSRSLASMESRTCLNFSGFFSCSFCSCANLTAASSRSAPVLRTVPTPPVGSIYSTPSCSASNLAMRAMMRAAAGDVMVGPGVLSTPYPDATMFPSSSYLLTPTSRSIP